MDSTVEALQKPVIELKQVNKIYPSGYHALKDINITVYEGEFLAVIGLSGSGKSTLLRCINRIHDVSSGTVYYKNQDITQIKGYLLRRLQSKIGMIFQHFNIINTYSVWINVLTGSLFQTNILKALFLFFTEEGQKRAEKALEIVGLAERKHQNCSKLSGGQKQRVAIARVLVQQPEVILADEPVASLDPTTSHSIMDYLRKINKEMGVTVVCNLHFLSLVRTYADRVIALKDGRVVFQGAPKKINEEWFKTIYGEEAKEVYIK